MSTTWFKTVADLLASTASARGEGEQWFAGDFIYHEAASAASDHHLTLAGGVKLYARPLDDGSFSVAQFNAKGDGVTDDSAAIQAAIDSLPDTGPDQGGVIVFPPGAYLLDTGLVTAIQNLELRGVGGGRGQSRALGGSPDHMGRVTLVVADNETGLTWGTSGSFLARGPVIRNLHFTAASASAPYGTQALVVYSASNWLIDNCGFSGFNGSVGAATISGASYSSGTVTFTTSADHGFSAGDLVQVLDVVTSPVRPNGYNACRKVLTVPSATEFTVSTADVFGNQDPGTYSSGGTAYALGMAVQIAKSSGVADTTGATCYGTMRDCTFASNNGLGGLWLDHVIGSRIQNVTFDGDDNALVVPAFGVGVAVTGRGTGGHRLIGVNAQGYQTLFDVSNGDGIALLGCRGEAFNTAINAHAPDVNESGGVFTNGGNGSGGTLVNIGPGATNLSLNPAAPLRSVGIGSRYTCRDATAGLTFSDSEDEIVFSLPSDFTVNNTTTWAEIVDFGFRIGNSATEVWLFEITAEFEAANATGDLRFTLFSAPTGATFLWGQTDLGGGSANGYGHYAVGSSPLQLITSAAATAAQSGSFNGIWGKRFAGKVYGGGTAGFVQFAMTQNVADASDLTMLAGSCIRARRIQP